MRKLAALIFLAVCAFLGAAASNEFAPPRIETVPVPGDEPLTLRFSVTNRGYLSTFRDLNFTCVPDKIESKDAKAVSGASFPLNVDLDLGPGASFEYTCPLKAALAPDRVATIRAHVEAAYSHLGHQARTRSRAFIWDAQSKVWLEADG